MLVIRPSAKIMAMGTAEAPIVMTSSKPEGSRARGGWGGLIVNGRAPINSCADEAITDYEAGEGNFYGGNDPADSSGVLNYLRIQFAEPLSPDNELNGIAFQGVGSGTDRLRSSPMNADDGIEFFGGTANMKHVVVSEWATTVGLDRRVAGQRPFIVLQQHDNRRQRDRG